MIKSEADFLEDLYLKAKLSFNECILKSDNDYLKDEVDVQMGKITLVGDFIRVL